MATGNDSANEIIRKSTREIRPDDYRLMESRMLNLSISEIKPAKYNPRRIDEASFEGLCHSLRKFGMPQPLVVNKQTGNLVAGHQRLRAAKHMGWKEVPVVYVDPNLEQEKALNVTLNNKNIEGNFTEAVSILVEEVRDSLGDDFIKVLRLDLIVMPELDFSPGDESDQGQLDQKQMTKCPQCGEVFDHAKNKSED